MAKRSSEGEWRADCLAAVAAQADWVAEGILIHEGSFSTSSLVLALLEGAGVGEVEFLINWVAGKYDGE